VAETATKVSQRVLPSIEIVPPGRLTGGKGWRRIELPISNSSNHVIQPTFVVLDDTYNNLLAITRRGNGPGPIFRSIDGGASWKKLSSTAGGRGAEVASLDIEGGPAQGWHVMAVDDRGGRETDIRVSRDGIKWTNPLRLKGASTYPSMSQHKNRMLHVASAGNAEVLPSPVIGWNVVRHYVLDPDVLVGIKTPSGPPIITMQPRDQSVYPGWKPYFYCLASGAKTLRYQWQVSADGSSTWSNVSSGTVPQLQPLVSLADNGKRYRCRVTNGSGSVTSAAASLEVNSVPSKRRKMLHLKFDEARGASAADASGNGHHAKVRNTAAFSPSGGKLGGALSFSGGHNDWEALVPQHAELLPITVPSKLSQYPVSQWTVSFWVNASEWGTLFAIGQEASSTLRIGRNNSGKLSMEVHKQTITRSWPKTGAWHHMAFAFDGNTFHYYLNGKETASEVLHNKYLLQHVAPMADLELGGTWWGTNRTAAFKGLLDDLRYYDFALTPSELQTIMDGGEVKE